MDPTDLQALYENRLLYFDLRMNVEAIYPVFVMGPIGALSEPRTFSVPRHDDESRVTVIRFGLSVLDEKGKTIVGDLAHGGFLVQSDDGSTHTLISHLHNRTYLVPDPDILRTMTDEVMAHAHVLAGAGKVSQVVLSYAYRSHLTAEDKHMTDGRGDHGVSSLLDLDSRHCLMSMTSLRRTMPNAKSTTRHHTAPNASMTRL